MDSSFNCDALAHIQLPAGGITVSHSHSEGNGDAIRADYGIIMCVKCHFLFNIAAELLPIYNHKTISFLILLYQNKRSVGCMKEYNSWQ